MIPSVGLNFVVIQLMTEPQKSVTPTNDTDNKADFFFLFLGDWTVAFVFYYL
jgi:hypothetical protein